MKNSNQGLATIEYLLLLPVLIVTLLMFIHYGLQMVRMATMKQVADESAEALARIWMTDDNEKMADQLKNGSYDVAYLTHRERYWWLNAVLLSGGKIREAEKQLKLRLQAQAIFDKSASVNETAIVPEIRYTPDFCGGTITVNITWSDRTIFGGILARFGLQKQSDLSVHAYARVADPREFINNTDYVLQLLQKTNLGQTATANIIVPIQNSIRKLSEE